MRSSSSSRRETPRPSPCGTKTTKRPGSEISRRQPRALRLHRVLDRLDEDRLAAADQVLDLAAVAAALELGADDLVDVEEAVLLEADLDERGLHARAGRCRRGRGRCCRRSSGARAARGRPRRPGRPRGRRRAARRRRPRRAARASRRGSGAGAAARGGGASTASRRRSCRGEARVRCGLRSRASAFLGRVLRVRRAAASRRGARRRLLAPAPASAAAAALRLGRIGRFGAGRFGGRVGQLGWSGGACGAGAVLDVRLLASCLSSEPVSGKRESPSRVRARKQPYSGDRARARCNG